MTRSLHLGMRILCFVLCLVGLLSMLPPTVATAEEDTTPKTLTAVIRLNAREGATPIGQLEDGTQVTVLDEGKAFYKIDCYDMTGYVAKKQIVHREDGNYYVNCTPESSETRVMTYTPHTEALALRHSLVALGKENLGYRYRYGGTRPGGFDCSGLMLYLYGEHGIKLHRTASQQLQDGIPVPREGLQVGDLIFFCEPARSKLVSHVGIYIGDNRIIHSGSKGTEIADLDVNYYVKYYKCARRIINTAAAQMQTASPAGVSRNILTADSISGRTVR